MKDRYGNDIPEVTSRPSLEARVAALETKLEHTQTLVDRLQERVSTNTEMLPKVQVLEDQAVVHGMDKPAEFTDGRV